MDADKKQTSWFQWFMIFAVVVIIILVAFLIIAAIYAHQSNIKMFSMLSDIQVKASCMLAPAT